MFVCILEPLGSALDPAISVQHVQDAVVCVAGIYTGQGKLEYKRNLSIEDLTSGSGNHNRHYKQINYRTINEAVCWQPILLQWLVLSSVQHCRVILLLSAVAHMHDFAQM